MIRLLITTSILAASIAQAQTSQPSACYEGPLSVRVENPDGTPAANAALAVFGGWWRQKPGQSAPERLAKAITDANGVWHIDQIRECDWPTFIYAFDEQRELAGFALFEDLKSLGEIHTVRLHPARWVVGAIDISGLFTADNRPDEFVVCVSPQFTPTPTSRALRLANESDTHFRFLLPPGDYFLSSAADRLKQLDQFAFSVAAAPGPHDLGRIRMQLSPLTLLIGKPAPEIRCSAWNDHQPHSLSALRGKRVLLSFWWHQQPDELAAILQRQNTARAAGAATLMIIYSRGETLDTVRRNIDEQIRRLPSDARPCDPDLLNWTFLVGIDAYDSPSQPITSAAGKPCGYSAAAYGGETVSFSLLIDAAGNTIANSRDRVPDFEASLKQW